MHYGTIKQTKLMTTHFYLSLNRIERREEQRNLHTFKGIHIANQVIYIFVLFLYIKHKTRA